MLRLIRVLRRSEEGAAIVAVVMTTLVFSLLAVGVVANSIHANDSTTLDRHRENAFQAAAAGVDDALDCLAHIAVNTTVTTCSKAAASGTQLTQAGNNVGQYGVTVTDVTPGGSPITVVKIAATGYGPQQTNSYLHSTRVVTAEVNMVPFTGFFDSLFAGDEINVPNDGDATLKNTGTIAGSIYAAAWNVQKNGNQIGDLRVVGDVSTGTGDQYNSIWAGGNVTLLNNTQVSTSAKACGAGPSPGNFVTNNGVKVNGNLQYRGTLTGGGTYGSATHTPCAAPSTLDIPSFTYNESNYPGWTIIPFTTVAAANACLATVQQPQAQQISKCIGKSLGDKDKTVGKSLSGTVIYVNDPTCGSTVTMGDAAFTGNFTLVSTCPMDPIGGAWTRDATAPAGTQLAFIAIGNDTTSLNTSNSNKLVADPSLNVLLYSTGSITGQNDVTLTGAVYARHIVFKNKPDISASTTLGTNPPGGFTFDPSSATNYTPVVREWRETAS